MLKKLILQYVTDFFRKSKFKYAVKICNNINLYISILLILVGIAFPSILL